MEINFTADVPVQKIADSICENDEFVKSLTRSIADNISTYDIANELSVSDIAYEIDSDEIAREIAESIDDDDIARCIDLDDLAREFDYDILSEKIAEHMPEGTSSDDLRVLQQRVDTLTQTVERLMGVLDWSLDNMRMGIVHVDTNQDFKFGAGIEPVEPKPVWTIEEILEQEDRIVDHHAQTQDWNDRPNYL
jgi:hypothetical protein